MEQTLPLHRAEESKPEEGPSHGAGDAGGSPKPVGRLRLLSSEKDFWIYLGKNTIGRRKRCQICLPAPSVSKDHALIEVLSPNGPHVLYDHGSLNKTQQEHMELFPHNASFLRDGDALLFGDVECQYFILRPEGAPEPPKESFEVPPAQPGTSASALAIEETPAPGRKMSSGVVMLEESDTEEEGEEVRNGAGKMRHLPVDGGEQCSL
ncbi:UNVERIFIED_CONTAM: hypothetical protein K2H54_070476 [Gekko kuhli]